MARRAAGGERCQEAAWTSPWPRDPVLTSLSRLYLISYLRMRPLGFSGSRQRRRTLFLLAGSQVRFPGMLSA